MSVVIHSMPNKDGVVDCHDFLDLTHEDETLIGRYPADFFYADQSLSTLSQR